MTLVPLWLWRIAFLLVFLGLWEAAFRFGMVNPIFAGHPVGIFKFLFEGIVINQAILEHLFVTLASTLAAFALGSVFGILTGLMFVNFPTLERFLDPIFSGLNALPRIALAPLFLLWFGLGMASKIALGVSLTYFIVLSSTVAGARSVNTDHLVLARTLGASSTQIFRRITLWSAIPTVFSGLRLGLIYALLGVVGGEIIAAQRGLGQYLSFLAGTFQLNGVFAVLLLLALIGTALTWIMSVVETRLLQWR